MNMDTSNLYSKSGSRRDFLAKATVSGIGMLGLGAFIESCAEKEIGLAPTDLAQAYIKGLLTIINKISTRENEKIGKSAALALQAKLAGRTLYADFVGNMFPHEIAESRPGSPHLFKWTDYRRAAKGDIVITNNPETARGLGEQNVKIIGLTTPAVPNYSVPPDSYENMGVFRIEDVSDIIIDCHVPYTDGILNVEGIEIPICPASGIVHSLIYYALVADIVEGFTKSGIYPQVG